MAPPEPIRVEVVLALPRRCWRVELVLPSGATAETALARSGLAALAPEVDFADTSLAIHGRAVDAGEALSDGDRVEILRPLLADPKAVRRARALKR